MPGCSCAKLPLSRPFRSFVRPAPPGRRPAPAATLEIARGAKLTPVADQLMPLLFLSDDVREERRRLLVLDDPPRPLRVVPVSLAHVLKLRHRVLAPGGDHHRRHVDEAVSGTEVLLVTGNRIAASDKDLLDHSGVLLLGVTGHLLGAGEVAMARLVGMHLVCYNSHRWSPLCRDTPIF